jgi:hypothetical protein
MPRTSALSAALFAYLSLVTASAQTLLPPEQGARLFASTGLEPLKCRSEQLRPVLDFNFHFRAGYVVHVPLSQYSGRDHRWAVVVRIQPEGGTTSVFLVNRLNLPDISDPTFEAEAGGGYLLGVGRYHASLALLDDQSRICRAEWDIDAQLGVGTHDLKMRIAPAIVRELSQPGEHSPTQKEEAAVGGLTIFLNAAPVSFGVSRMPASDAEILLGALSTLLDLIPARSVRLVMFNLDQQKEIYRREHFTSEQMEAVRQAIFELQLATVDKHQLQNPTGSVDLLKSLVDKELQERDRSNRLVFLGPHARSSDKRAQEIGKGRSDLPGVFYLEYLVASVAVQSANDFHNNDPRRVVGNRSRVDLGGSGDKVIPGSEQIEAINGPARFGPTRDSIDYLVAGFKGKTLRIGTPAEFSKAINEIVAKGVK